MYRTLPAQVHVVCVCVCVQLFLIQSQPQRFTKFTMSDCGSNSSSSSSSRGVMKIIQPRQQCVNPGSPTYSERYGLIQKIFIFNDRVIKAAVSDLRQFKSVVNSLCTLTAHTDLLSVCSEIWVSPVTVNLQQSCGTKGFFSSQQ